MNALHANDLTPADFWKEYVGAIQPREFLARARAKRPGTPEELVQQHAARLPAVFGLVLRGSWRNTFSAYPYTREQVEGALLEYLEETRCDWEAAWAAGAAAPVAEPPAEPEQVTPSEAVAPEPAEPAYDAPPEVEAPGPADPMDAAPSLESADAAPETEATAETLETPPSEPGPDTPPAAT